MSSFKYIEKVKQLQDRTDPELDNGDFRFWEPTAQ